MTVKRMLQSPRPRATWLAAVLLLGAPCLAAAEETIWRAVKRGDAPVRVLHGQNPCPLHVVASTSAGIAPIATLGRPVPLLPEPVPIPTAIAQSAGGNRRPAVIIRAQAAEPDPLLGDLFLPPPPKPTVTQVGATDAGMGPQRREGPGEGTPELGARTERTLEGVGTAPPQPTDADSSEVTPHTASGLGDVPPPGAPVASPPDVIPGVATDRSVAPSFWEKCKGWMQMGDRGSTTGRGQFQSDTAFCGLISPVTNPFFFEDPRALTELRPIFMYQSVPGSNPKFGGGDVLFFGTQARVAFTTCLSLVINELGFVTFDPSNPKPPITSDTGFAEIKIGPKYTFARNCSTGTVAAAGLTFEIPEGSGKVFQDTGTLSLDPYFTIGHTFGRLPNGFGTINLLGELGYSFALDDKRTDFFHASLHADYNIANSNTFYPLVEMNWLHYTDRGKNTPLTFEGGDLVNFGASQRQGSDVFSLAFGGRYRITEHIFAGAAFEFPLTYNHGIDDWRVTIDLIFRY